MDRNAALIGLDLGTTGLKAVGLCAGEVFAEAHERMEYRIDGSRMEFEPELFSQKVMSLISRVAARIPTGTPCAGIAISSASGNTALIGEDGMPLTNFISWRDKRQTVEAAEILGPYDRDEIYRLVGWPFSGSFPLGHLCWLAKHESTLLQRAKMVCMSADYINYRLTGQWAIDPSTATTFFLQDQQSERWHAPFLEKLGLSAERLPNLMSTGSLVGGLTPHAARETGLPVSTPVFLGSFDHPSAARGAGVLNPGEMLLSCGTSWVCFLPIQGREEVTSRRMLCDPFLRGEGLWAGMRSLANVSGKIESVLAKILPDTKDRFAAFDRFATESGAGAGGLILRPEDDFAREERADKSPAHVARALMEGTAYALRERIDALEDSGVKVAKVMMVGGPSGTQPWPEIVSGVLNRPIGTVNGAYAGAVGAAAVAGVSAKVYADIREASRDVTRGGKTLEPSRKDVALYNEGYQKYKAMGDRPK